MSGFEYHLACRACGLTSATYPWLHDSVVAPTVIVLPTTDRAARAFGVLELPLRWRLTDAREIAAAFSNDQRTVIALEYPGPIDAACPRCGERAVERAWGGPPRAYRDVDGVAALIDATRALAIGGGAWFRVAPTGARVHCERDEHGFSWDLLGAEGRAISDEICDVLARTGATIRDLRRGRGYARFAEYLAP